MTICQDFRCVFGCESDGDCGGNYCRPDHTCSAYPVYSAAELVCAPCDTDANCTRAPGFYCIPFHYVNGGFTHDGNYCLRPATACGGLTAPLSRALTPPPEMSVDGFDTRMGVCGPPTSCEALTDAAGGTTCGVEDECGLAGATDGVCDIGTCSLRCATSNDCPTNRPNCPASRICTP